MLKEDLLERAGALTGTKLRKLDDALRFALGLEKRWASTEFENVVSSLSASSANLSAMTKESLVRFGVAMETSLVAEIDRLAEARGCNRSELLRDLARAEVGRTSLQDRVRAFAAITLVYNHHVRELSEKLTALQHDLGDQVRSTMHVHLDREHCLEVIVMRGRADELKEAAGKMLGTRGVLQGGAEYVVEETLALGTSGRRTTALHAHDHDHDHHHLPAPSAPKPRSAVKRRGSAR